MGYLYKLIDKKALNDAKDGKIALSRPIFSFQGSEGRIIDFAKDIKNRYCDKMPTMKSKDEKEIEKWIDAFKKSYPEKINDYDLITEAQIIFHGILSAYCGYFTTSNLDDPATRKEYIEKNYGLKDKIAYIKIDERILRPQSHWRSSENEFVYQIFNANNNDLFGRNGFLHPIDVEYIDDSKDYYTHLKRFNNAKFRDAHYWFTLIDKKYEDQKEKRLVFLPMSLEPHSCTIAVPAKYPLQGDSIVEKIFTIIVNTIDYCITKGEQFIYLKLDPSDIVIEHFVGMDNI